MADTVREFRIAGPDERKAAVAAVAAAYNAENDIAKEESNELIEELASTTVLHETFGRFIKGINETFAALEELSEEGNPVRTHIAIIGMYSQLITTAHQLRDELIEKLAQRGDEITEQGGTLRKQVLDDDDDEEIPF
jgi:hypothetical protein